jgi:hypothetical protein
VHVDALRRVLQFKAYSKVAVVPIIASFITVTSSSNETTDSIDEPCVPSTTLPWMRYRCRGDVRSIVQGRARADIYHRIRRTGLAANTLCLSVKFSFKAVLRLLRRDQGPRLWHLRHQCSPLKSPGTEDFIKDKCKRDRMSEAGQKVVEFVSRQR